MTHNKTLRWTSSTRFLCRQIPWVILLFCYNKKNTDIMKIQGPTRAKRRTAPSFSSPSNQSGNKMPRPDYTKRKGAENCVTMFQEKKYTVRAVSMGV